MMISQNLKRVEFLELLDMLAYQGTPGLSHRPLTDFQPPKIPNNTKTAKITRKELQVMKVAPQLPASL